MHYWGANSQRPLQVCKADGMFFLHLSILLEGVIHPMNSASLNFSDKYKWPPTSGHE